MKDFFEEGYLVRLNYKKEDGFWVIGHEIEIFIKVKHGIKEKQNHKLAEIEAKKRFKECKIIRVSYI